MTAVRYAPGDARIAVADEGVVVLAADAPEALATAAWEHVRAGAGIVGVIDVLAADRPLSTLPGFAIVVPEADGWRVAVRGAFTVTLADGASIDTATGAPWVERSIPDDVALTVAAGPVPDVSASLPLLDGVAQAAVAVVTRSPISSPSRPSRASAPVEPVQPYTVAEVHDSVAPVAKESEPPTAPSTPDSSVPSITDSIPEHLRPARAAPVAPPPPLVPPVPPVPSAEGLGDAEDTLIRSDPAPALADDVEETVIRGAAEPVVVGDHDGETLSIEEARRLRAAGQLPPAGPAEPVPPAAVGRAVLSTGQVVSLDRILVVGRRPRSTRATGTVPHLVAVDSPQQDISRNHLELRPEGDSILATDLDTTNGTILRRAGAEPVKLHPSEPTIVVTGDVLDLGEGITVTVEAPE